MGQLVSETSVEVRTRTWDEAEEYDVHVHCCVDTTILLCGFPADGPKVEGEETTCVVCAELEETDYCPRALSCDEYYLRNYYAAEQG